MEVEHMSTIRSVRLTLEQLLESVLLGVALMHGEILDSDTATRVILNAQRLRVVADVLGSSQ